MKKLLAIAISAAALSGMSGTTVQGGNEIGTLAITASQRKTVVAVPFAELGSSVDSIKPSDLILTTNLTDGDQLYVYQGGAYKGWVLSDGAWTVPDSASIGSDGTPALQKADASTTVSTGSGFWLVRGSSYTEGSFTFYIYGQYKPTVTSTIVRGAHNLIANPKSTAATFNFTGARNGDYILVPGTGKFPKRYEYNGSQWFDGTSNGAPSIPAGQGFWYISAAGTGGQGTFTW